MGFPLHFTLFVALSKSWIHGLPLLQSHKGMYTASVCFLGPNEARKLLCLPKSSLKHNLNRDNSHRISSPSGAGKEMTALGAVAHSY